MTISNLIHRLSILATKFNSIGEKTPAAECSDLANMMLDEEEFHDSDTNVKFINRPLDFDPYYRNSSFVVYHIPGTHQFQIYTLAETAEIMTNYNFKIE